LLSFWETGIFCTFQARILFGAENYCSSQNKELLFLSFRCSAGVPPREFHLPQILNQRALVRAVILGGTNSPNLLNALRECEIWFIGDSELPWYARCAQGYRESMVQAGLQPRFSEIHSYDRELGYLAMRSILSRREPVTAVIAGSDQIARGAYEALNQFGLRIPDDISVAGFNDSEASLMHPPLTSVREFPEELGKHLAEFVLRRIQEPEREPQQRIIPTRVIVRESTRARAVGTTGLARRRSEAGVISEL
jgi:hypothetical protein